MEPPADPSHVALLRRQLARERRARRTAEDIGERATGDLFHTVQQLRAAEGELRRRAEEQEVLRLLAREVRTDLDKDMILRRAVTSVAEAAGVDRCLVRLADGNSIGPIVEQWSRPGVPPVEAGVRLPARLEALSVHAAQRHESLWIDDVCDDPRLGEHAATAVLDALGSRSYAGTPMWVGSSLVGWLVLHKVAAAEPWTPRQRAIVEGLARDLGTALLQAQAFAEKSEAVQHLQEVNLVKTEFVATVSHELRTPLTSIAGYLELLVDGTFGALTDRQQQLLDVIGRNGDRLMALVEDLLTLSRLDSGQLALTQAAVDVHALMPAAERAVRPLLAGRDVALEMVAPGPLPAVVGDSSQIERVLVNLLSNAVKFSPDGSRVRALARAAPGGVQLVVEDTGYGIAEADLPHVFRRFFRTATATELAIQGSGLGLAVVRTIVEEHGGTVDIASTLGEGTTVTVTLPAAGATVGAATPPPSPPPPGIARERVTPRSR